MASKDNVTPEEIPEVSSEPQEETPASSTEESAESTEASASDADGASEETAAESADASEGGDQLIQHPDGRFEVRPAGHFPVIVEVTLASELPGDEPGVKSQ